MMTRSFRMLKSARGIACGEADAIFFFCFVILLCYPGRFSPWPFTFLVEACWRGGNFQLIGCVVKRRQLNLWYAV